MISDRGAFARGSGVVSWEPPSANPCVNGKLGTIDEHAASMKFSIPSYPTAEDDASRAGDIAFGVSSAGDSALSSMASVEEMIVYEPRIDAAMAS